MEAYSHFADVYDKFMDNVPYDEWSNYIEELLIKYGITEGLVLELGCGTGEICERMAKKGYEMIGIDNSEEMLSVANGKKSESGLDILYLLQDMTEFELYGTVKAVISICDSMNYITETEDLVRVFTLVNNYLDPSGIFIFDLNTEKKYEDIGDCTIAENRDDTSFIWENTYYEDEKINEYDMTIFIKDENGKYDKYEETHIQRAYSTDEIKEALNIAGMEYITCLQETEDRMYIIAREKGK